MKFIFFGTPKESVLVLETLAQNNFLPELVVTAGDRPVGRGLVVAESPVAIWAKEHDIAVYKPESLKNTEAVSEIENAKPDMAIVFAYGKIIPQSILDIPKLGTFNIHPSLLPLHRGPSPVEGAILSGDKETGVSIMLLDNEMDHGPILAQEKIPLSGNETAPELLERLVKMGAEKLVKIIPDFANGKISPTPQDHTKATYTKKITKSDGEIKISEQQGKDEREMYQKYLAYFGWPGIYFFDENGKRNKITKARFENEKFIIEKIIPEGKNEIGYNKTPLL